ARQIEQASWGSSWAVWGAHPWGAVGGGAGPSPLAFAGAQVKEFGGTARAVAGRAEAAAESCGKLVAAKPTLAQNLSRERRSGLLRLVQPGKTDRRQNRCTTM